MGDGVFSIIPGYEREWDVKELFGEYTSMLLSIDPSFSIYLELQHFSEEEAKPAAKYAMPDGRLYIAVSDESVAGCVALRRLDANSGEVKRLYVRPLYRGMGIASALLERIIADARSAGYGYLYLDTLPELKEAVKLYEKFGFEYVSAYNDSPAGRTLFMRLELSPSRIH